MTKRSIDESHVNIDVHPGSARVTDKHTQVTIGDLHANAIALLYFLIKEGICTLSPEDYTQLVTIYKTPCGDLTAPLLGTFNTIIARLQIVDQTRLVRLIGDELADRGQNDYFVLKLLEKLHQAQVPMEILYSNHGAEFIIAREHFSERGHQLRPTTILFHGQAQSLTRLADLIKRQLVTSEEVLRITDTCYKPMLKLMSYSRNENTGGITLYSHAPIDVDSIPHLATKLGVRYQDGTSLALASTIDQINEAFTKHVTGNTTHTLLTPLQGIPHPETNPLEWITWNRNYHSLKRNSSHRGYSIGFVHGHDCGRLTKDHIINLDGYLGKGLENHIETYKVLLSDETSPLVILEPVVFHLNEEKHQELLMPTCPSITDLQNHLDLFKQREIYLRHHKKIHLADEALALHTALQLAVSGYAEQDEALRKLQYSTFKETCTQLINNASPALKQDRDVKQFLINFGLCLAGLGIIYLAAIAINKTFTNRFLFFPSSTLLRTAKAIGSDINKLADGASNASVVGSP